MSILVPATAGEAVALIQTPASRTRPASSAELYQALNYGVGKAIRAISAVRPQYFATFLDPFTLQAGVDEYDLSLLSPPLFRVHRLVVSGNHGVSTVIFF
ncbi:MAG: hypothetical protein L3K06_07095, partial [Thermoplasmata archaeon]|nr:hypothetical protein [Thermoplasmata archaeon]